MSSHTFLWWGLILCSSTVACAPALHEARGRDVTLQLHALSIGDGDAVVEDVSPWSSLFEDPDLEALVQQALAHNQELDLLQQEVAIERAELRARRGEVLPSVDAALTAGVEKVGRDTSQGAADELTRVPDPLPALRLGFRAVWEVDVWKRLRNASKAARLRYLSSVEGREYVATRVVAEVAQSWFELRALDATLAVVDRNIAILADSVDTVRLQKAAGQVTELAVQRFQAELLDNESRRVALRQQIVLAENRLNLLCGRPPQPIARNSTPMERIPTPPPAVPSALLENRPDLRAAEHRLEAAKLDVSAARAAFYPSLGIDAQLGVEAFAPDKLVRLPESLLAGVAGGLVAPLVNRSALRADHLAANARQTQAAIDYERTLLTAWVEVVNQLSELHNVSERYAFKQRQVAELEAAVETSTTLFRSARADYLEVLTTRREALEAQVEAIEVRQRSQAARIALYQALGGGWSSPGSE